MLLDRRKVKFWQKIVFGFMALLMAAFLIVGYSGVLNGCTGSDAPSRTDQQLEQDITRYRTAVQADPKDVAAWISLAEAYLSEVSRGSRASSSRPHRRRSRDRRGLSQGGQAARQAEGRRGQGAASGRAHSLAGVYSQLGDSQAASGCTATSPR